MRSIPLPSPGVVLGSLVGLAAVLVWRIREARGPVSLKKIIIPPLGMATGFSMFVVPAFRIPWTWAVAAFIVGAVVYFICAKAGLQSPVIPMPEKK